MLTKLREDEFDMTFRVMEQSFPTDEYRPYDEQRALLADPRYTVYVHHADNGDVDAFLAVWRFDAFAFLEHFAVAPAARNCGLGTRLLEALGALLGCGICLEAELPDTPLAVRRIDFYRRAGFIDHDYPYVQPSISKGKQPVPLRLMTRHLDGEGSDPESIKRVLYREVYRVDDAADATNNEKKENEKI